MTENFTSQLGAQTVPDIGFHYIYDFDAGTFTSIQTGSDFAATWNASAVTNGFVFSLNPDSNKWSIAARTYENGVATSVDPLSIIIGGFSGTSTARTVVGVDMLTLFGTTTDASAQFLIEDLQFSTGLVDLDIQISDIDYAGGGVMTANQIDLTSTATGQDFTSQLGGQTVPDIGFHYIYDFDAGTFTSIQTGSDYAATWNAVAVTNGFVFTLNPNSGQWTIAGRTYENGVATNVDPLSILIDGFSGSQTTQTVAGVDILSLNDTTVDASARFLIEDLSFGGDPFDLDLTVSGVDFTVGSGSTVSFDSIDLQVGTPPVVFQSTIDNPTPSTSNSFGFRVALSDDLALISSISATVGSTNTGVAYLYDTMSGTLLQTLSNPTPASGDEFGYSVALDGNLAVVGGRFTDGAYLYDAATGALLQSFQNPSSDTTDGFGYAVDVSGNHVLVGGWLNDTGASQAGTAYLFDATTGALVRTFVNPTPEANDFFGSSVAVLGDLALIGAFADNTGAGSAGSAYLFRISDGQLLHTFTNPAPGPGDNFGHRVALTEEHILIGAYLDDGQGTNTGSAYLFDTDTGALLHTLVDPNPEVDDFFGFSLDLSDEFALIAAHRDDVAGTNSGQAYLFDVTTGALVRSLQDPSPMPNEEFGSGVALSQTSFLVGAWGGSSNDGQAHLYSLPNETPDAVDDLFDPIGAGETRILDVLANDTDPDGDDLEITEVEGTALDVGDSVDLADGGKVTLLADGTLDFDPDGDFDDLVFAAARQVSFEYTIVDVGPSIPGSDTAMVTFDVFGDARDDDFSLTEGETLIANLFADNGSGADAFLDVPAGEGITSLTLLDPGGNQSILFDQAVTLSSGTRVAVSSSGLFVVDAVSAETLVFEYEASNLGSDTDTATVTVDIQATDFVAPQDDTFTVLPDGVLTGNLFDDNGSGVDTGSGPLTLTRINGVDIAQGPFELASGAQLSVAANGDFTYTPLLGDIGPVINDTTFDNFVYEVASGGQTDTALATVGIDLSGATLGTSGDDGFLRDAIVLGLEGNDNIRGRSGDDFLNGGAGNDFMNGVAGNDVFFGGDGGDAFVFDGRVLTSGATVEILDLNFAEGDTIRLLSFAPNTFDENADPRNLLSSFANDSAVIINSFDDFEELETGGILTRVDNGGELQLDIVIDTLAFSIELDGVAFL